MRVPPLLQVRKIVFSIYLDPTDPTVRTGLMRALQTHSRLLTDCPRARIDGGR